jgi:hypothetical protein
MAPTIGETDVLDGLQRIRDRAVPQIVRQFWTPRERIAPAA